jgi:hypothetical protein
MRTRLSSYATSFVFMGLVAALGGAGCGGDDDDSHGNASAGTAGTVTDDDDDNAAAGKSGGDDDDDVAKAGSPGDDDDAAAGNGGAATDDDDDTTGAGTTAGGTTGDDDDDTTAGGETSTGGKSSTGGTSSTGGKSSTGGTTGDDDDDTTTAGAAGQTSTPPVGDEILDDLIEAVCGWEFKCCDAGERKYRLSPYITDAADCKERFVYQLRESNETENPYLSGNAAGMGMLGLLGYTVDLSRVTVNAANVQACIDQWNDAGCATELTPSEHCTAAADAPENPCALDELFGPKLALNAECTPALTEGAVNDIECLPGSTCVEQPAASGRYVCVRRGVEGGQCTKNDDCDFDFYCTDAGKCTAKAGAGEDCSYEDPEEPIPGEEKDLCKAGLTCNPVTDVCVEACAVGSICPGAGAAYDPYCPAGTSCAPLTVNDDTTSFHVCRALGKSSSARCDDEGDCEPTWFCAAANVCAGDVGIDDTCSVDAQCPEGTYCNNSTLVCTAYANPGVACDRSGDPVTFLAEECGARLCIADPDTAPALTTVCSSSKLNNGDACLADYDCKSGRCEQADEGDATYTCTAGAAAGADCDDDLTTADGLRCRPGLACIEGACVAQVGPGQDCESATAEGVADSLMCTNSACVDKWEQLMCTDTLVPKTNGGTGLTCDGT